jgi:alpha-beta hydrolase superfamily lysophospholipase
MTGAPTPDAFWFGSEERRAFGWYHAPSGSNHGRDTAVVLCPPLGHEMLCMHRAYRHLAERLAALGFPVLRFDYHGTGDSVGDDHHPDRVPAWLGTIEQAVDMMRDAGAARVALVGVRMGATLAAVVASRRTDVGALVLVAPCASGSTYLRELRAMHKLRDRGERRPPFRGQRDGDEEAIGFVFRRETIEGLAQIDLRNMSGGVIDQVLIVPRDDLPGAEPRIAERLRARGSRVDVVHAAGYATIAADDPYLAGVPVAIWTAVSQWLDAASPTGGNVPTPKAESMWPSAGTDVVESAIRFGVGERLFGILSEPVRTGGTDLAVVVSNTGANSRVGPNRLGVTIARRLAARGHAVLRFDLGGIGDSAPAEGTLENELYASHSIGDVRASIDALVARGYRRFVALGLCAGAYMSFQAGVLDERIQGLVLMNPAALEWQHGRKVERLDARRGSGFRSTRYYKHKVLRLETWKRVARGDVDARGIALALGTRLRDRAATSIKRTALVLGRGHWVMSDLARKFTALAQRDAQVLLLLNSDEPMLDELDHHLGSMMPWLETRGLSLEVIDDTDHVFAPVWSQERATDVIAEFVDSVARAESQSLAR